MSTIKQVVRKSTIDAACELLSAQRYNFGALSAQRITFERDGRHVTLTVHGARQYGDALCFVKRGLETVLVVNAEKLEHAWDFVDLHVTGKGARDLEWRRTLAATLADLLF